MSKLNINAETEENQGRAEIYRKNANEQNSTPKQHMVQLKFQIPNSDACLRKNCNGVEPQRLETLLFIRVHSVPVLTHFSCAPSILDEYSYMDNSCPYTQIPFFLSLLRYSISKTQKHYEIVLPSFCSYPNVRMFISHTSHKHGPLQFSS